jgi:hypothetical protein
MTTGLFDRDIFFGRLRKGLGALRAPAVAGAETLLGLIEGHPEADLRVHAYALATAWHETAYTLTPIAEIGDRGYFDCRYDPVRATTSARRNRAKAMGNLLEGDGYRYRGRGYVQLTWQVNYARAGRALGVDLASDPDLALQPAIAYACLDRGLREGWYTGAKIGDYLTPTRTDYRGARACVNGTDKAVVIARYADVFEHALRGAYTNPPPGPPLKGVAH